MSPIQDCSSESGARARRRTARRAAGALPFLLVILALACTLPTSRTPTPSVAPPLATPPAPTPPPPTLPPSLVESSPLPGSEIPLDGAITLYFNQPMERASVEAALSGEPSLSGRFDWVDEATLRFVPDAPFLPETRLTLRVSASAQSMKGIGMHEPVSLAYQTAGYLRLAQRLPLPGAVDVDPASAVVAAFDHPVVPLGGDPATLPAAFSLEPPAPGDGEWINTSTYIFYPRPAFAGGQSYLVRLAEGLQSTDGVPLESAEQWTFTTAQPRLVSIEPADGAGEARLDAAVRLTFNQQMNPESVAANFSLTGPDAQPVPGQFAWNEDLTSLVYTPTVLLQRGAGYTTNLAPEAQAAGGTPLGVAHRAAWSAVSGLSVTGSTPAPGGVMRTFESVAIYFSAHVPEKDVLQHVAFEPQVPNLWAYLEEERILRLYGDYQPDTSYTLTLRPSLRDAWGDSLNQPYQLGFRTAPLDPSLSLLLSSEVIFVTPQNSALVAQATNLPAVPLSLGSVPLSDFFRMLAPGGYDYRQNYQPTDQRSWQHNLELAANRSQAVEVPLTQQGESLDPGLYQLRFNLDRSTSPGGPYLVVASHVHLAFKLSATDALVWAVDLRMQNPLSGVPVTIYDEGGSALASGSTNTEGIFHATIPPLKDVYATYFAVTGRPGEDLFSLALSNWSLGLESWDFGIPSDYTPPGLKTYLYTDRPIYRPGQTMYFRAISRQAFNGRYTLPDLSSLTVNLYDPIGVQITPFEVPLSAFGSGHGAYTLPADARPGYYRLGDDREAIWFQVAEYRKPEINLQVQLAPEQALAGQNLEARIEARYFFDAPAGNVPLQWALYAAPAYFPVPGYQVGAAETRWLDVFRYPNFGPSLGNLLAQGEALTGPDGRVSLDLPTETAAELHQYTLEVTAQDESGLPVSARAVAQVNPGEIYLGVKPDAWFGRAGRETGFEVLAVDWEGNPARRRALQATFQKVVWEEQEPPADQPGGYVTYVPRYTPIASSDFAAGEDGLARLAFTPPEPGTYQLEVSGSGALTQLILWVGGSGEAIWPNLPNQRLQLSADREIYQPGDTARVFVPNPLGGDVLALVTLERGVVMQRQVLRIAEGGEELFFALGDEAAPNVYVAVTLLGRDAQGRETFRHGYIALEVTPIQLTLNVSLTAQPERAGPGETVVFNLKVADRAGNPVQGEFSLSLVDLAVLALADPNAPDILHAFYDPQPLGVRTSLSLAAHSLRYAFMINGLGGGGEELASITREQFPDTAFWQAQILTDANGEAQITLMLPDSLTTWQADLRGLTADSLVGQARAQVVASKDLLVRPVVPRFLVASDRVLLAAVVQNNTSADLVTEVSLQSTGVLLDGASGAAASVTRQVTVPAAGRARVEWWGVVEDTGSVDLVFTARSGSYSDATRPAQGALPVLRYLSPQAFATSGILDESLQATGGERLELVSLPLSFDPTAGELRLELSPSLAAVALNALDALEHYPYECIEQTLSRFLPNLETYRALQSFGMVSPDLQARLERTLKDGLARLAARQNLDGGWGWWAGGSSDAYITAYVVFGLSRAQAAGISLNPDSLRRAIDYLYTGLVPAQMTSQAWQLDRLAFVHFALSQAGAGDLAGASALFSFRDQLSPWAQALLALALESLSPGSDQVQTLLSDLQATAVRSATGVHWETGVDGSRNLTSSLSATAMAVYALAQRDPASPLLADAVRFLMAHRRGDGSWSSTYETAWVLLAITEAMKGTGELGGDFSFAASLNGAALVSGQAVGEARLTPVRASVPLSGLYPRDPNALSIQRGPGPGRLYYTAILNVYQPVENVAPLARGLRLERAWYPSSAACLAGDCPSIQLARAGERVTVRLALVLPHDAYHLIVEDYIPAGSEILDISLKTSQLGSPEFGDFSPEEPLYDPRRPFAEGWGWWYFQNPLIYDDHITWAADYLPAGTYELTYTLVVLQPGEYRVLPARAWQFYFPEVQGSSAGAVFEIEP